MNGQLRAQEGTHEATELVFVIIVPGSLPYIFLFPFHKNHDEGH